MSSLVKLINTGFYRISSGYYMYTFLGWVVTRGRGGNRVLEENHRSGRPWRYPPYSPAQETMGKRRQSQSTQHRDARPEEVDVDVLQSAAWLQQIWWRLSLNQIKVAYIEEEEESFTQHLNTTRPNKHGRVSPVFSKKWLVQCTLQYTRTSHFLPGARNTRPCITGQPVYSFSLVFISSIFYIILFSFIFRGVLSSLFLPLFPFNTLYSSPQHWSFPYSHFSTWYSSQQTWPLSNLVKNVKICIKMN